MSKILIEDINKLLLIYKNKEKIKINKIGIINIIINKIETKIEIFLETQTKIFKIELINNKIIKVNENDEKSINSIIKQLISNNPLTINWENFMYQK